jgi:hypothetical protein
MKAIIAGIIISVTLAPGFAIVNAASSESAHDNPQLQFPTVNTRAVALDAALHDSNSALRLSGVIQTSAPLPLDSNIAGMLRYLGYDYK